MSFLFKLRRCLLACKDHLRCRLLFLLAFGATVVGLKLDDELAPCLLGLVLFESRFVRALLFCCRILARWRWRLADFRCRSVDAVPRGFTLDPDSGVDVERPS